MHSNFLLTVILDGEFDYLWSLPSAGRKFSHRLTAFSFGMFLRTALNYKNFKKQEKKAPQMHY